MTKNFAANLKIGAALGASVGRVFGGLKTKIKDQEATLKRLRAEYKAASKGTGEFSGSLDKLQKEISEAESKLKSFKNAAKFDIRKGFSGVGSTFATDAKRLATGAGVLTAAITGVGAAIYSTTRGFVDWADDIGDSAEALNMSTQALQTWQFAAATVGVGGAKMTASIAKFSKAIMEGGDKTDEALGKLTINANRLRKLGLDEQLEVVAEAFKNYKGADKAALAMKLFGKSGYQLAGILSKGKDGLDEFRKAGEETGAVLDDEAAAAAGNAASALDMFGITMIGLRNTIAIQFVPTLTRLAERFTTFVRSNGPQIREWATKFAAMIETKVVPALGKFLDKLPGIVEGLGNFAAKAWEITNTVKDLVGGWENLGIALVAINFAPTIAGVVNLTAALWKLSGASWAAVGPWGLIVAGVALLAGTLISIVDPGGPLDILGKLFPETMEKIRTSLQSVADYISGKIDALTAKVKALIQAFDGLTGLNLTGTLFDGFGGAASSGVPNYAIPRKQYGSILGVPPKGTPSPLTLPPQPAPAATKEDILEILKPQSSNNTYNINVNAPGADGDRIAERIRRAFEQKPLFDSDRALAPG